MMFNNRVKLDLRELLTEAAHFYADKLGIDKELQDKIELEILVRKSSDRGACYTNCSPKRVPKFFTIELNPDDDISILQTLAHEMVHARQFLRGQLDAEGSNGWVWKGRNAGGFEYENQPWEKEAYRLEKTLFVKCFPFEMKFTN